MKSSKTVAWAVIECYIWTLGQVLSLEWNEIKTLYIVKLHVNVKYCSTKLSHIKTVFETEEKNKGNKLRTWLSKGQEARGRAKT